MGWVKGFITADGKFDLGLKTLLRVKQEKYFAPL